MLAHSYDFFVSAGDEIHVHSDPEHEFEVEAAADQKFTFSVDVAGQYAVESHELELTICKLQLTDRLVNADRQWIAHGVGGRDDLPIPTSLAFAAAAFALLASFAVLASSWLTSRFVGQWSGRPLRPWLARLIDSTVTRAGVVVLALALTG